MVGLTTLASQPATRTTRRRPPSLDPATRYASDVLAGKVVAGRLVRLACQRHLDDLRAKGRLVWKPELADWAAGGDEFGENLLTPGDFNIDRLDDPLYQAFVATGLRPAPEHVNLPRTLFDDPDKPHFYDQIAWFTGAMGAPQLTPPLRYEGLGGNFDFRPVLQKSLSNVELSWRISDHFPLWASFSVRADVG